MCILGVCLAVSSCAKPADYSTQTGKRMFPSGTTSDKRARITEVSPASLKLKGFDDIHVFRYALKVDGKYTARGYLFTGPKGAGVENRILFAHWLGGGQGTDGGEREFFTEACEYAREGNVCAIPSGFFPWMTSSTGTGDDVALTVRQVNDYRVALDVLFKTAKTTTPKAMVISHDYGAMFAILTAAADTRVGAAVIMAPVTRFYLWNRILRRIPEGAVLDAYRSAMDSYDPVSLVGELSIPILFQYAETDQFVGKDDADALVAAASRAKKTVDWYPATHALQRSAAATADRKAWVKTIFAEWDTLR
jgi:pimeloyl-ACP methyl ester carboxylesterase